MRVLHIIDTLWLGGAQTIVKSIIEYNKTDNDYYIYSLRKTEPCMDFKAYDNVFQDNSSFKISFLRIYRLKTFIKKNKIDVLHCHLQHSLSMGYLIKKFYFPSIKLIFHEHAEIYNKGKMLAFLIKRFNKKIDLFIACSSSTKNELINRTKINSNRIVVLRNFIDTKIINPEKISQRKRYNDKLKDFVVGFAGRLTERKGWKEFIHAAYILREQKNIKFIIAGVGSDKRKVINEINRYNLINSVQYLGFVNNMQEFYSKIDCFVLPSYWEGLALVQLESMAYGIPHICSDAPGLNEITENRKNCLFFKLKSEKDLAYKIIALKDNAELYNNIRKNALIKVKEFAIDDYMSDLEGVYLYVSD